MNSFGKILEDDGIFHAYCTDHNLHLTCKIIYENSSDACVDAVKRARKFVTHFEKSKQSTDKWKKQQSCNDPSACPLVLLTDVCTRWWSTYRMVECLLRLKNVIGQCYLSNNNRPNTQPLTEADWEILRFCAEIMKPVKESLKLLEGEYYITGPWVPFLIRRCRDAFVSGMAEDKPNSVRAMSKVLKEDFDARWGSTNEDVFRPTIIRGRMNRQIGIHHCFITACALDPRFKHLRGIALESATEKEALWEHILSLMIAEYNLVQQKHATPNAPVPAASTDDPSTTGPPATAVVPPATTVAAPTVPGFQLSPLEELAMLGAQNDDNEDDDDDDVDDAEETATHIRLSCLAELARYKKARILCPMKKDSNGKIVYTDPLEWWKKNEYRFFHVAALAKTFLAIRNQFREIFDSTLGKHISNPLIIAVSRPKNLRERLCSSKLQPVTGLNPSDFV